MHWRDLFTAGVCPQHWAGGESCGELERRHCSDWQHGVPGQCQSMPTEREERSWAQEQGLQQSPAALSSRGGAARARGWAAELVQDTIFPAKEGARKKRDRGRESQGAALGKFSLKSVCFCFHIHKYCELFVSTTQLTHFHLRDRTLQKGKNSPRSQGQR